MPTLRFADVLFPGDPRSSGLLRTRLATPSIRSLVIVTEHGGRELLDAAAEVASDYGGGRWVIWAQRQDDVATTLDALHYGLARQPDVLAVSIDCRQIKVGRVVTQVPSGRATDVLEAAFEAAER